MRTGGFFVHSCLTNYSIFVSLIHVVHELIMRFRRIHGKVFNEDSFIRRLLDFKFIFNVLA
jgi:hypothetical protein